MWTLRIKVLPFRNVVSGYCGLQGTAKMKGYSTSFLLSPAMMRSLAPNLVKMVSTGDNLHASPGT